MRLVGRLAQLDSPSRRLAARRKLHLGTTLAPSGENVVVHNISQTGLLIETDAELATSQQFEVELPDVGATVATVIWNSDNLFGCQFRTPIPTSAMSAALLRSPFGPTTTPDDNWRDEGSGSEEEFEDDRYRFGVRLRVILGLSAALWGLILWSVGVF